jgi:hypothetical protein
MVIDVTELPTDWAVVEQKGQFRVHVMPRNDTEIHSIHLPCVCAPAITKFTDYELIIHNAFDGRE